MCLEMTFLDALARQREAVKKKKQSGGGAPSIYGPQSKGRPPGPNGQNGGGGDSLPRYGPTSNIMTKPPGPNASLLS